MKRIIMTFQMFGILMFGIACASVAQAQATRTWVSGAGDDANPCTLNAPCRTFAGAISKTAAGGEIRCLEPGEFGAIYISKSITIDGEGTFASILAAGANGIVIDAASDDRVTIRNLLIDGDETGINGIQFLAGSQLSVENCKIFGFTASGIDVSKTASGNVFVKDTNITKCTTAISLIGTPGFVTADIDSVRLEGLAKGVVAGANSFAVLHNSSIFSNTGNGIQTNAAVFLLNGASGDIPLAGDWDGNGTTTVGVFRSSNNTFYLSNSNSVGFADLTIPYGAVGDVPIVGDWDGNGTTTIGVYRPSTSTFYLRNSNSIGFADIVVPYGGVGDVPVVGDWDGNGTTTIGVFRPSNNTFYLRNSNSVGFADLSIPYAYGASGDRPVAGKWN